jgi:glycosyltransferase involved in cell wall biosynthesis
MVDLSVSVDDDRRRMGEVSIGEQSEHLDHVPREEEIVVTEIRHDASGRLLQRLVSEALAVPLPFRRIEEADACIFEEWAQRGSGVVFDAVAYDEDFDLGTVLRERTAQCDRQESRMTVRRNEDRRVDRATVEFCRVGRGGNAATLAGRRVIFVFAGEILGGAERGALDLAVPLARAEGAAVEIMALDDRPGRARTIAEAEGIPWTTVRTPWTGGRLAKTLSLLRVALGLRRLRPDVLLAHTNFPNVVSGLIWRLTGAKVAVWNQWDVLGTRRFSPALFRRALRQTPLVVTEAFHARDWLVQEWGADPRRVHVIRGDVQLPPARESRAAWRTRVGLDDDVFVACMLANFHSGKDHTTLLHAWRRVVDALDADGRTAVLLLAGRPAGTESSVKALAFDLDLRDHIRFLGDVEDVRGLLGAVDLAVFSSRSELFGRAATEPMLAGLPVVGTDVPGISEPLGEAGHSFLAPPGDAAGLAEAILQFAYDPELRVRVGEANAELLRGRQPAESTSRVYARLLADALAGWMPDSNVRTTPEQPTTVRPA